jgi:hypothetical protein
MKTRIYGRKSRVLRVKKGGVNIIQSVKQFGLSCRFFHIEPNCRFFLSKKQQAASAVIRFIMKLCTARCRECSVSQIFLSSSLTVSIFIFFLSRTQVNKLFFMLKRFLRILGSFRMVPGKFLENVRLSRTHVRFIRLFKEQTGSLTASFAFGRI